jgi:hypothetical protein
LDVIALTIEELPDIIKGDVEDFLQTHPRSPAARLRPKMGMSGDLWLAFVGPNLREGAAGLGVPHATRSRISIEGSWNQSFPGTVPSHISAGNSSF